MSYAPVQKEIVMSMKEDRAMLALLIRNWGFWVAMLGALSMGVGTVYFYIANGLLYAGVAALVLGVIVAVGIRQSFKTTASEPEGSHHDEKHDPAHPGNQPHHQQSQKPRK
jgi:hypothetical protein